MARALMLLAAVLCFGQLATGMLAVSFAGLWLSHRQLRRRGTERRSTALVTRFCLLMSTFVYSGVYAVWWLGGHPLYPLLCVPLGAAAALAFVARLYERIGVIPRGPQRVRRYLRFITAP